MSRSEFRWNKKRKHYAYLHKDIGKRRKNILITSKPYVFKKGRIIVCNVRLVRHPYPKKNGVFFLIPKNYLDDISSFDEKVYIDWNFDKNDKRKVKRIRKNKCK